MTNDTTSQATLYRKLAIVAGAALTVEKDGKNKDQNYRYATPAAVMTALKPLLADQKIAIIPHLVEFLETDSGQRSGGGKPFILNRVLMHYHIVDGESGEAIVVPWQGQAGTYGDDKGLAKAQTIALRTFLIQLFQIPAEDPDTDPDARDAKDVRADDRRPTRAQPATYTPAVAPEAKPPNVEAKLRFLAFASEITGKPIRSWGDALKVWKTSYDEPQTVDEWRAAASAFRAAVKPTQAGLAAEYEDIETTEKQLSNGAAGVAR